MEGLPADEGDHIVDHIIVIVLLLLLLNIAYTKFTVRTLMEFGHEHRLFPHSGLETDAME